MSSAGTLAEGEYTKKTVAMAQARPDFVRPPSAVLSWFCPVLARVFSCHVWPRAIAVRAKSHGTTVISHTSSRATDRTVRRPHRDSAGLGNVYSRWTCNHTWPDFTIRVRVECACVRRADALTRADAQVMGFISTHKLSEDPGMVHMTPGVQLESGSDALGQRYLTPEVVLGERGSDIIIVGRGVYKVRLRIDAAFAACWT
eukprot:3938318-Rhodomonas_salina.5